MAEVAEVQTRVFEARQRGLPPMRPYLAELWRRRQFAFYMARTELKGRHADTVFGQVWIVLNPVLLGLVYWFVVEILRGTSSPPGFVVFIFSGLFAFYFTRNSLGMGASSIVGGGGYVLNTTLPRAILPLSSVVTAFLLYMPMLGVYFAMHWFSGGPWGVQLVFVPVIIGIQAVLNLGLALGLSALTVYFRDTSSLLPYFLRIWLYLSPVLWAAGEIPERIRTFLYANPLFSLFTAWHQVLTEGRIPDGHHLAVASAWALLAFVVGTLFFVSKEREFAVRI